MKEQRSRRFMVGLATGIAVLAVGAPCAGAGNCAVGYCFVPAHGANAAAIVADGPGDNYWRDELHWAAAAPSAIDQALFVDSAGPTHAIRAATGPFDWGDFGLGIGAAVGSIFLLAGLGATLLVLRPGRRGRTSPAS